MQTTKMTRCQLDRLVQGEILHRLRLLEDDKMAQYRHAERDRIVILNASASLSTGSVKT